MRSLLYAIGVGILGALVLHIVIILATPLYSGVDSYARVLDLDADGEFNPLPATASDGELAASGPFVREAVCAFSTEDGPIHLVAQGDVPLWSAAVYTSTSNEVFSMTDRTSVRGFLDIVVGTDAQIAALKNAGPDTAQGSILVTMQKPEGYAVIRAVVPQKSMAAPADAFLAGASCDPVED